MVPPYEETFTMNSIRFHFPDTTKGVINVTKNGDSYLANYPCSSTTDCEPYDLSLRRGIYLFELWGAAGGKDHYHSDTALGAYVSGKLVLLSTHDFKVYIGGKGMDGVYRRKECDGGYNGGGKGGYCASSGGGATDVRLNEKRESRVIVAAGAGGAERAAQGHGGEIQGIQGQCASDCSIPTKSLPGTQTSGGSGGGSSFGTGNDGSFGKGGDGNTGNDGSSGGGAGYYGGGATTYCCGGSGGSSFISGHKGCNAILSEDDHTPTDQPIHYSKIFFTDTIMYAGNQLMPNRYSDSLLTENQPISGAFRVTLLQSLIEPTCAKVILFNPKYLIHVLFLILK